MSLLSKSVMAAACGAALLFSVSATAEEAPDWAVRAEVLAHRMFTEDRVLTDRVRSARVREADRAEGRARLQILYDLAADDYVASAGERVAVSMPAFENEAAKQHDVRFLRMASMLHAYAPALDGDYVAARRNLEQELGHETDGYAIAAGERFRAYALTDLGLVGNALEAARSGLAHLPRDADADTLRSGLQDALSYTSIRIGDVESGFEHLQRSIELDIAAGHPVDGLTVVYNVSSMLADQDITAAALRMAAIDQQMAARAGAPAERFFADLLCAKVNFSAHNYVRVVQCGDQGRAIAGAPPEYMTRLLVLRARGLARMGAGHRARQAVNELRQIAAQRGDPALIDKIDSIEPEVLRAEGRAAEAFAAMRDYHDRAERTVLRRFNAGVKELRATMENEITRADDRAAAQSLRSELQAKALQGMALAMVLGGVTLCAAIIIALLIYRSRRAIVAAVQRAEQVLARRVGKTGAGTPGKGAMNTQRLAAILDEIERRDIELKKAFEELEAARFAAEDANLAKSQFLTTMSHELRTPLNAIIGYSEMMMESEEEAGETRNHADLGRIHGAGKRLLLMVNDLLDLAKIESGRTVTEAHAVDMSALLDDIVDTVSPAADSNGNAVVTEFQLPLGDAETDGFKLSQCLLNLMSNALKFTKNGVVRFAARRVSENGADWFVFDVIDNGIGISPEAQKRLFQPFVQADASTTRAYGGTGLGLAITRRLAQLLGGDVSVQSTVGQGATFTLRVPARLRSERPPAVNDDHGLLSDVAAA